jgi:hypothetical protein
MLSFVICSAVLLFAGGAACCANSKQWHARPSRGAAALLQDGKAADHDDEPYIISSAFNLRNLRINAFCWPSDLRFDLPGT